KKKILQEKYMRLAQSIPQLDIIFIYFTHITHQLIQDHKKEITDIYLDLILRELSPDSFQDLIKESLLDLNISLQGSLDKYFAISDVIHDHVFLMSQANSFKAHVRLQSYIIDNIIRFEESVQNIPAILKGNHHLYVNLTKGWYVRNTHMQFQPTKLCF
ncbi:hypothetical protein DSO57_1035693, partial [Entomophthora muscae]